MQTTENVRSAIHKYGVERKPLERLYRQLFKGELYLTAYGKLYGNRGALTVGASQQTADRMSQARINQLIEQLKSERYHWTPVRRLYIPKKDGSQRPLGIPTWEDKLLQEVIRMLLEAYYEPRFSDNSHGFRPNRGCHTALQQIQATWKGTIWFIEGDISKCFDSFNHEKLVEILARDIKDGRFITLVRHLLKAGCLENWQWKPTPSGTPQGGIVSPLLANIYLNELDKFVEETLLPEYNTGHRRPANLTYKRYAHRKARAKQENDRKAYKAWDKRMRSVPSLNTHDPNYRRLRYLRYADDFLLGFAGPKTEAEEIKKRLAAWLSKELVLELSQAKTVITHSSTTAARFLGYDLAAGRSNSYRDSRGARNVNNRILLYLPKDKLNGFIRRYTKGGKPVHRCELVNNSDYDIVAAYQAEYRGYVQYYQMAQNLHQMHKLYWVMSLSMLKTLAHKHKSTVQKMANQYKCTIKTETGQLAGFRVIVTREGKPPLITEFGGIHLTTNSRPARITDELYHVWSTRTELIQRLQADVCEMCGSKECIEVHHIRKLADLHQKGRSEKPLWVQKMAAFRRKTLVVCRPCHDAIHAGRTRPEWH